VSTGAPAPERPGDHTADAVAGLEEVWRRGIAEVEVTRDTDAATRLSNRRDSEHLGPGAEGADRLRLHFVDLAILADELAAFGPEVLVLSPPDLRDAVRERLERAQAEHEGHEHDGAAHDGDATEPGHGGRRRG
jgi:proteasome accessory factor B